MIQARYTRTAIALHWLTALLIVVLLPLGIYMADLALSPLKLKLISYHKWLGVTVFLLLLLRLGWRLGHVPPPLPDSMPLWQRQAAHGLHHLMYLLLFAIPLSGWLMSSAKGFQTVYLGLLPLPDLISKDKALGDVLGQVHETLNMTLLVLLLAHVGAALKHHYIERDGILARMLPFLDKGTSK